MLAWLQLPKDILILWDGAYKTSCSATHKQKWRTSKRIFKKKLCIKSRQMSRDTYVPTYVHFKKPPYIHNNTFIGLKTPTSLNWGVTEYFNLGISKSIRFKWGWTKNEIAQHFWKYQELSFASKNKKWFLIRILAQRSIPQMLTRIINMSPRT